MHCTAACLQQRHQQQQMLRSQQRLRLIRQHSRRWRSGSCRAWSAWRPRPASTPLTWRSTIEQRLCSSRTAGGITVTFTMQTKIRLPVRLYYRLHVSSGSCTPMSIRSACDGPSMIGSPQVLSSLPGLVKRGHKRFASIFASHLVNCIIVCTDACRACEVSSI